MMSWSIVDIDAFITTVISKSPGKYYKFAHIIREEDWIKIILPYIEKRTTKDKLILHTMTVFTPHIGAFFLKNIDTLEYRDKLKDHYSYLIRKGNAFDPPTYKSKHLAMELSRNLKVVYNLNTKITKVITNDGTRHEYAVVNITSQ